MLHRQEMLTDVHVNNEQHMSSDSSSVAITMAVTEDSCTIEPCDNREGTSRQNGNSTSMLEDDHTDLYENDEARHIEDLIKRKENEELDSLLCERPGMLNICNSRFLYQPIHMAAKYNNLDFMIKLVENESTVIDFKNDNGSTVLHISTSYGSSDCSNWLIEKFPQLINQVNCYGNTALHYVTRNNDSITLKLLLNKGANILIKNVYGNNPLDWAKERCCSESLEELQKALREGGLTDNGKYADCDTIKEYDMYLNWYIFFMHFCPGTITTQRNLSVNIWVARVRVPLVLSVGIWICKNSTINT